MRSTSNITFIAAALVLAACGTQTTDLGELLTETGDDGGGGASSSAPSSSDATSVSSSDTRDDEASSGDEGSSDDEGSGGGEACGNGRPDPGEACDDGDDVDGNGCNTDCVVSGTILWSDVVDVSRDGSSGYGRGIAVAPDDSVFVTASIDTLEGPSSLWLRRYASDGSVLWTDVRSVDGQLYANDLEALDTGTVVAGLIYDDPTGARFPRLLGLALDGETTWELTYAEPTDELSIAKDSDGLLAVSSGFDPPTEVRRYGSDGAPQGSHALSEELLVNDVASFPDGGFVVVDRMGSDAWLRRYTAQGDELWTELLAGHTGVGAVAVTPSEQIVVAGYGIDYFVEGFDADGELQWSDTRTESPGGWFYAFDVAVAPNGQIVAVGQRNLDTDPSLAELYVARYEPTGALLWEQSLSSFGPYEGGVVASSVAIDGMGNAVVVGSIQVEAQSHIVVLALAP